VIVAMITSQTSRADHPSRVSISTASALGKKSGLLTDSVVMTDNLATIVDGAVYRIIGSLPMTQVDAALRHTLGLSDRQKSFQT
jgi:mRNA interferase MazF